MRRHPAWPARVAAAGTIPRELRAINDYGGPDPAKVGALRTPAGHGGLGDRQPPPRDVPSGSRVLPQARVAVLPGRRHAAHQTAPELVAAALRNFISSQ